jgi:uncharacterized protein (TIGR03089 family)
VSITQALLGPLLASGAPRPLITYYDDATGARVELSRATVANWAAKTANWLVDEIDLEPGTSVAVALPAHWQTAGVLLGSWWCGAHVTDDPQGSEVAFVPASAPIADGAHTVAAVGLDALGAPARDLPEGVVDYVSEVRVHGDDFAPLLPIPGSTRALGKSTVDELLATARDRAAALGIGNNDRVLSTLDWDLDTGVLDGFLSILSAGASLVQCANLDPTKRDQRRSDERITVELGT